MIAGGLRSLAAVAGRRLTPYHGADGADALQGIGGNGMGWGPTMIAGGLRSLAAVAGRKLTPFHGADGADAQGIGRPWHGLVTNDDRWRAAVPRSRGSLTNDSSRLQAETCNRLT